MKALTSIAASFILVAVIVWVLILILPTTAMSIILGLCLVIAVVGGAIRLFVAAFMN
jgi:hypothetical protein